MSISFYLIQPTLEYADKSINRDHLNNILSVDNYKQANVEDFNRLNINASDLESKGSKYVKNESNEYIQNWNFRTHIKKIYISFYLKRFKC